MLVVAAVMVRAQFFELVCELISVPLVSAEVSVIFTRLATRTPLETNLLNLPSRRRKKHFRRPETLTDAVASPEPAAEEKSVARGHRIFIVVALMVVLGN